jgi:hypothetical protein
MHENIQSCDACGSSRVVSGRLDGGDGPGLFFEFSESNGRHWFTLSHVPLGVSIRQDRVRLCLDCGKVTASMSVDVEKAKRVLEKWGTDALKSRLDGGDAAK